MREGIPEDKGGVDGGRKSTVTPWCLEVRRPYISERSGGNLGGSGNGPRAASEFKTGSRASRCARASLGSTSSLSLTVSPLRQHMVLGTTFLLSRFVLLIMMGAGAGAGGGSLTDVRSQRNAVQRRLLASTQLLGFTRVHVGRILSVAIICRIPTQIYALPG